MQSICNLKSSASLLSKVGNGISSSSSSKLNQVQRRGFLFSVGEKNKPQQAQQDNINSTSRVDDEKISVGNQNQNQDQQVQKVEHNIRDIPQDLKQNASEVKQAFTGPYKDHTKKERKAASPNIARSDELYDEKIEKLIKKHKIDERPPNSGDHI